MQQNLFPDPEPVAQVKETLQIDEVRFDGSDYRPALDDARLAGQILRIFELMKDGAWRTLGEIAAATGDPQASISAQLRHLRKLTCVATAPLCGRPSSTYRMRYWATACLTPRMPTC